MITVHKINGDELILNVMMIKYLHVTPGPDTRIVLTDGSLLVVREGALGVSQSIEAALRRILGPEARPAQVRP